MLAGLRLGLGTGTPAADRERLSRVADWPAVAGLAVHHRVGPLLLRGIRAGGIRVADAAVERDLERRRRNVVLRGVRRLDAMRRAADGLDARGVPWLILKGLPLGKRLYGDPFTKISIDIDLLVPPDGFDAAARALRDLGWRRTMPNFAETPARKRWYDALEKEHVFVDPRGGRLELHRRLFGNPFLFDPAFATLSANAVTVRLGGHPFRTLGDDDQLLYLACHGALHHWQRLQWLCDFAALFDAASDGATERAAGRGRRLRLDHVLASAMLLSREALHAAPPRIAAPPDAGIRVRFMVNLARLTWRPPTGGLPRVWREAAMRAGRIVIGSRARYALHDCLSLLIQPHDFARVELPDRVFWLYALARPVLWLRRALRRPP
jgi:hypothetical protein